MSKAWIAALGNRTGWALAVGLCAIAVVGYFGMQMSPRTQPSRSMLDPSIAQTIRVNADVEPIADGMAEPGDAGDDYNRALLEALARNNYRAILTSARVRDETDPDSLQVHAPDDLLAGAAKKDCRFIERLTQPGDWMAFSPYTVKALESIRDVTWFKAHLLAKAGRDPEARALLEALLIFGWRLEQERVRLPGLLSALSTQQMAARKLQQICQAGGEPERAAAIQPYLNALHEAHGRVLDKAALTVSKLDGGSPPTADLLWLIGHDEDCMWRIEAILILGLAQWTAPRAADRLAAAERIDSLLEDADPWLREAARAAAAMTADDVRKVR